MKTAILRWTTLIVALVVVCSCYTVWAEEQKPEGGEPTQVALTPER
jgi:lipopolysaccharide export system protein LptC